MNTQTTFSRVSWGTVAGLIGGLVASWAANKFHSQWSKGRGEPQVRDVTELSQRGGRPDSAAAKEKASVVHKPQDDATVQIASKASEVVLHHPLNRVEKHQGGVAVHYIFGAATGALYGAAAEVLPSVKTFKGLSFGSAVWLVAVEIGMPITGLAEPPWRYPIRMHVYSFISHLIYGGVTETVRKTIRS